MSDACIFGNSDGAGAKRREVCGSALLPPLEETGDEWGISIKARARRGPLRQKGRVSGRPAYRNTSKTEKVWPTVVLHLYAHGDRYICIVFSSAVALPWLVGLTHFPGQLFDWCAVFIFVARSGCHPCFRKGSPTMLIFSDILDCGCFRTPYVGFIEPKELRSKSAQAFWLTLEIQMEACPFICFVSGSKIAVVG